MYGWLEERHNPVRADRVVKSYSNGILFAVRLWNTGRTCENERKGT